jgi:hypothetical protein
MELAAKLQIKPGMQVAVVAVPTDAPDLAGLGPLATDPAQAGAVIAFARRRADLSRSC